jgi:hypothetical protein
VQLDQEKGLTMNKPISWGARRRTLWFGVLGTVVALVLTTAALWNEVWRDRSMPIQGSAPPVITADDLAKVDRTRVYFAHQSVGMNILDGVSAVFAAHNVPAPPIEEGRTDAGSQGGFIAHEFIGKNEQPFVKVEAFDKAIRGGMAEKADVALMKFCYMDFNVETDVDALFTRYKDTMAALESDYPAVTFIHATVPLMTEPGLVAWLKSKVRGNDRGGRSENIVRERFNTLMVNEYRDRNLFDLAAVESTEPNGTRDLYSYDGQDYFALYSGYASDRGHLNQQGSEIVATAFLRAIAKASQK